MGKRNTAEGYLLADAWKNLQPKSSEMPDDCEFSDAVYPTTSLEAAMLPVAAADDGSNFADETAQLQAAHVAAGILETAASLDSIYIPIVKYTQPPRLSEYFAVTAMVRSTVSLPMIVSVPFVAGTIFSRDNWRGTRGNLASNSCQPCIYRRRTLSA